MTLNKKISCIFLLLFFTCFQNIISQYIEGRNVDDTINETKGERNLNNCGNWIRDMAAPWHVGIYKKQGENYVYFCGGSIISPNVIVTAAHCLKSEKNKLILEELYIGAGKYYSEFQSIYDWAAQYRKVKRYHITDDYKPHSNLKGDIGLLILNEPLETTFAVQPVCVDWNNQFENDQLFSENIGHIQGWGSTEISQNTPSEFLMQLNVPFKTQEDCINTVPIQFQNYLTEDKFCAGYTNGSAVCNGDDGGGLVFPKTEEGQTKYFIRGLLSTYPQTNGVCEYNYGVYTKISYYRELIQKVVNENRVKPIKPVEYNY